MSFTYWPFLPPPIRTQYVVIPVASLEISQHADDGPAPDVNEYPDKSSPVGDGAAVVELHGDNEEKYEEVCPESCFPAGDDAAGIVELHGIDRDDDDLQPLAVPPASDPASSLHEQDDAIQPSHPDDADCANDVGTAETCPIPEAVHLLCNRHEQLVDEVCDLEELVIIQPSGDIQMKLTHLRNEPIAVTAALDQQGYHWQAHSWIYEGTWGSEERRSGSHLDDRGLAEPHSPPEQQPLAELERLVEWRTSVIDRIIEAEDEIEKLPPTEQRDELCKTVQDLQDWLVAIAGSIHDARQAAGYEDEFPNC